MIELKENAVFAGRYKLERQIGIGGFSEVWLAKDQMTENTEVALKVFVPEKGLDDIGIKQFSKEYALTQPLNHSNLLKASYFDIVGGSPYLVMPFMANGSLGKMLYEEEAIKERDIALIIKDIASALSCLHQNNIVHQDIKPDNILIDSQHNYMLTDFGISSKMRSTLRKHSTSKNSMTVAYAPPERFGKRPQTVFAGDVFSLAVMVYELTTGDVPWMGAGGVVLSNEDQIPLLPETYSEELCNLIEKCMAINPDDRPTTEELVSAAQAYLQNGKWQVMPNVARKKPVPKKEMPKSRPTVQKPFDAATGGAGNKTVRKAPPPVPTPEVPRQKLPNNPPPITPPPVQERKITIPPEQKEKLKRQLSTVYRAYIWCYFSSVILAIGGFLLVEDRIYSQYTSSHNFTELGFGLWIFAAVLFTTALILGFVILFKSWKSIQDGKAFATPGQAVGYLFIPFYNYYWIFIAFRRLFIDMNIHTPKTKANVGFATFVSVVAVIPYVNLLGVIFMPILFAKMKNNAAFILNNAEKAVPTKKSRKSNSVLIVVAFVFAASVLGHYLYRTNEVNSYISAMEMGDKNLENENFSNARYYFQKAQKYDVNNYYYDTPYEKLKEVEDKENWFEAKQINTVEGYFDFINDYPENNYVGEARVQISTVVAGIWDISFDWSCDGDYSSAEFEAESDGSFATNDSYSGTWEIDSDMKIAFTFSSGTIYSGQLSGSTIIDGQSFGSSGGEGCWYAVKE
jgi:serine/threonine protein kinase